MDLIENFSFSGVGYKMLVSSDGWQVAILNHAVEHELASLARIDRHLKTDEAFSVIAGSAWLIAAVEQNNVFRFEAELLTSGVVANIPVRTWHAIVMEKGAQVLIVEREGTHISDFEFHYLEPIELDDLTRALRAAGFGFEGRERVE